MDKVDNTREKERAILVGVHRGKLNSLEDSTEETLEELGQLADTAGAEVLATVLQNRSNIQTSTYIGEGKVEEVKNACEHLDANLIIFDDELTGSQVRNLENKIGVRVIDRSMLILDIFARRAVTKEGKIQVELAQLKYLLPRLIGIGSELSRLAGGIGTRGPGETKLETDRRHIRRRVGYLEEQLKKIKRHRGLLRSHRKKEDIFTVALVGYTNAGKSSLMNALSNANVFVEDRLFATLDPMVRSITLEDNQKVLIVDTVGLIRKLPHHLIEAFKSTLEEVLLADVLLYVLDSSSEEVEQHIQVVNEILEELGASEKPVITVYNKIDLLQDDAYIIQHSTLSNDSIEVSAITGQGISELLKLIEKAAPRKKVHIKLCIPYTQGNLNSQIHDVGEVISEEYTQQGIVMDVKIGQEDFVRVEDFIIQ